MVRVGALENAKLRFAILADSYLLLLSIERCATVYRSPDCPRRERSIARGRGRDAVAGTCAQKGLPLGLIGELVRSPPMCLILIQNLLKSFPCTESMPRSADSMNDARLRMRLIKRKTDGGGIKVRLAPASLRKNLQTNDAKTR